MMLTVTLMVMVTVKMMGMVMVPEIMMVMGTLTGKGMMMGMVTVMRMVITVVRVTVTAMGMVTLTAAAGVAHGGPGAVALALAHLGPHDLAVGPADILDLVVEGEEANALHLLGGQPPVADPPVPRRVDDLAAWGRGGGVTLVGGGQVSHACPRALAHTCVRYLR